MVLLAHISTTLSSNSMSVKKLLLFVVPVLSLTIIFITRHTLNRYGVPAIESKIDVQLFDLISNTPALGVFPVKSREGVKIAGDQSPFTGKMWYETEVNGSTADLVVYWSGDSNACQINKIEVQGTSLSPRVVWQRKN